MKLQGFGPQVAKPCNRKSTKAPKTDSSSIGWPLFTDD